jgi:hypothetical protein
VNDPDASRPRQVHPGAVGLAGSHSVAHDPGMALRRFLPPVVRRFRVQDATGQRLAYFYWWDDSTARYQADVLTEAEARRLAEDFANLSEL